MNNLQFAMEEDTLYSPLSPDVIDISSNSDNEFLVEPGNVPQLLDSFGANTSDGNPLTAFVGSAAALLFPPGGNGVTPQVTIDVRGTRIGRELMHLVERDLPSTPSSFPPFIDSELEPENESSQRVSQSQLTHRTIIQTLQISTLGMEIQTTNETSHEMRVKMKGKQVC